MRFCAQKLFRRATFYTQTLLYAANAFTHRRFYTRKPLHRAAFTHRSFYTQKPLRTETCAHRDFYTLKFLQVYAEKLLHIDTFTHRSIYTALKVGGPAHFERARIDGANFLKFDTSEGRDITGPSYSRLRHLCQESRKSEIEMLYVSIKCCSHWLPCRTLEISPSLGVPGPSPHPFPSTQPSAESSAQVWSLFQQRHNAKTVRRLLSMMTTNVQDLWTQARTGNKPDLLPSSREPAASQRL